MATNNVIEHVSSLTAPADRLCDKKFKASVGAPHLTEEQTEAAMEDLIKMKMVESYPKLERQFVDPGIPLQQYGLISFTPAKGATPDKDGIYGFAKCRGHYATDTEAKERGEFIVKTVDSYHPINIYYVGRPFPIAADTDKFSKEIKTVDLKQAITQTISEEVRSKREKEKTDIAEMKEREKALLDQGKPDYQADPYETYTMLVVKRAQLVWTYDRTVKQLQKIKDSIITARAEITKMDTECPEYAKECMKRYMDARRASNIPEEANTEDNWIKYIANDIDLGF